MITLIKCTLILGFFLSACVSNRENKELQKPNILFIISDDQSYPHEGIYGCEWIQTPGFDRIAKEGALFQNCYAASPSCSPSRASILTGKSIWELEEAGVHISGFPKKYQVYPDLLEADGYHVGYTGKPWAPGNWKDYGWSRNPAGNAWSSHDTLPPAKGMSNNNYAKNFLEFFDAKEPGQPFCFWLGGAEPHRGYEFMSGIRQGKHPLEIQVPPILPDMDTVRYDLADYALEIEYFDSHILRVLDFLEKKGELANTLVIVTGDNGMPFPNAKQNCYEFGVHVPLAICWRDRINAKQVIHMPVGFSDFAPTILEAAGLSVPAEFSGESLLSFVSNDFPHSNYEKTDFVVFGKERHGYSRTDNLCYPIRGIRSGEYLYLINFKPDRWPSGKPPFYRDSELAQVSGKVIMNHKEDDEFCKMIFHKNVDKRPATELYHVKNDPACIENLMDQQEYKAIATEMDKKLRAVLNAQNDPRILGTGDSFDSYPRFRPINEFLLEGKKMGGWFELGEYKQIQ